MEEYDIILRGGTIIDGSGSEPFRGDLAIKNDLIAAIGSLNNQHGTVELDVSGLYVAPGFINMLSQADDCLLVDGRSQSDVRQGVTLEVMGEGVSMGPFTESMKKERLSEQGDIKYDITWTKLSEYLALLVNQGVSTNIASFVGASTIRQNILGRENRAPTKEELSKMCQLVEQAMLEGAVGVSSALIYSPGLYATTEELTALCQVAATHNGMYACHLRSEGSAFLESLQEIITIATKTGISAEVYHLKAAGKENWSKMDTALEHIENARAKGLSITANMYTYTAAQTGLDAAMPPWVQEGGLKCWIERLRQAPVRERLEKEMRLGGTDWENGMRMATPEGMLLVGFKNANLKPFAGKSLAEIAALRGQSPELTAMDLVIEDESRIETVYFWMNEDNLRKQLLKPWVSIGSDGGSMSAEGVFLKSSTHPRAYGNVARFLSKYVRDQGLMPLPEAIRRLSKLPAQNMRLSGRGSLTKGYFADIVVFDYAKIEERATFEKPHQYASGFIHVFVNGKPVIKNEEHLGTKPGRVALRQTT